MGFTDKLKSVGYELIAPEKQELLIETKSLEKKLKQSPIKDAIVILEEKIKKSKTGKERYVLEEQLEQLKKLKKLYEKFLKTLLTQRTKQEINQLFYNIKNQINLNTEEISDDYEKIKELIQKEKERLEDTIDITSYNTIRDLIEASIDIDNTYESLLPKKYQEFFDKATIIYIDFIEEKLKRKLTKKDEKIILSKKGLLLTPKQVSYFLTKLANSIENPNINFFIYLYYNGKIKKFHVNLSKFKTKEKQQINQNIEEKNKKLKKQKETKKEQLNTNIEIVEKIKKLSIEQRINFIEKILNSKEFTPFLSAILNKLEGTLISIGGQKIRLTKTFIRKNKEKLLNNLNNLINFIIIVESKGLPNARNLEGSSAKGLGQWLDGNGHFGIEYLYNKKWYTREKLKKMGIYIKNKKKRKVRNTSSFETSLKNIYLNYPDSLLKKLNFKIPQKINKKINFSPLNLSFKDQIKLLILDIGSHTKKIKNKAGYLVGIKDFLGTALLGNWWGVENIYKIFHHTKPTINTLKLIKTIKPKFQRKLIKLY